MIHHITKLRNKNYMIISINREKDSGKIQHTFMIEIIQKVHIEKTCLSILKPHMTKL